MNEFVKGLTRYFSDEQISKIQSHTIGIGGAGGLGSNIAFMLTRCGFMHFEILDKDAIEPSNLNRQQYFLDDVGKPKAETLKNHLLKINPDLNIKTHQMNWQKDNAHNFFQSCDIMVEAFDKADTKAAFIETYQEKAEFMVSGNGMAGFGSNYQIKTIDLGKLKIIGDQMSDIKHFGPLCPRVLLCAAAMADSILSYVLNPKQYL